MIAAVPVAASTLLVAAACTSPTPKPEPRPEPARHRFFTPHQAAVVEDATARIAPGPQDDPAEKGHPGAREADVTSYIDTMLAALQDDPPMIFAGGPWSNRHTSGPDLMARFATLDPVAKIAWRKRLTSWQDQYRKGISNLDKLARGDFTKAARDKQDKILATASVGTFTSLLFEHTSRACTPARSTAATAAGPAGRRSVSLATSSPAASPRTRWSAPTATTPLSRARSSPTSSSSSA